VTPPQDRPVAPMTVTSTTTYPLCSHPVKHGFRSHVTRRAPGDVPCAPSTELIRSNTQPPLDSAVPLPALSVSRIPSSRSAEFVPPSYAELLPDDRCILFPAASGARVDGCLYRSFVKPSGSDFKSVVSISPICVRVPPSLYRRSGWSFDGDEVSQFSCSPRPPVPYSSVSVLTSVPPNSLFPPPALVHSSSTPAPRQIFSSRTMPAILKFHFA